MGVPPDASERVYFVTKYSTEAENKSFKIIVESSKVIRYCPPLNDK
jgi:hypothetical protein